MLFNYKIIILSVLGAVIYKALGGNSINNLFPLNITNHPLYLQHERCAHLHRQKLRTFKIKIKVKATNHKGIRRNLFELPDRIVEIEKMR